MDIERDGTEGGTETVCPHCGEAVIEEEADGGYVCPACGSSFDREDIDDAVDLDDEGEHDH